MAWMANLGLLPVLSIYGRPLQYWVADNIGYEVTAWIIGLTLLVAICSILLWLWRRYQSLPLVHLGWFLPLFLLLPLTLDRVEERVHFLSFGAFGLLSLLVFAPRVAFTLCLLISASDELLQHYLPDRVGDWRDVGFNLLASCSTASFAWLTFQRKAGTG